MLTALFEAVVSNLGLVLTVLFGTIGLLLIRRDRIMRAEILAEDRKAQRALKQQELDLLREQFEQERVERRERLEWLEREALRLQEIGGPLAKEIAQKLAGNSEWAVQALDAAKLGPHAATLFGERRGHFRAEKEFLASGFLPLLLSRCRSYVENGKRVYLVLDSGTTIYPFFALIGEASVRSRANKEEWIRQVRLVTNNLPGINKLMECGLLDPNNRYSGLAVECELLPGVPLPIYSALTGRQANDAIRRIRDEAPEECVFIGLVTGNWIRLRRSEPPCPVPLARGVGHLEIKSVFVEACDEVFVLAPLGKIFVRVPPIEVNEALGLDEMHAAPDKKPYLEVLIDDEKAKSVKLVTTVRPAGFVLSNLSILLENELAGQMTKEPSPDFAEASTAQLPHVLFPFRKLSMEWQFQLEEEFPHNLTRQGNFMHKYFFVPEEGLFRSRR